MNTQLLERWKALSKQDQTILAVLGGISFAFIFYAFCWLPIRHGLDKLSVAIPQKEAQLILMQKQALEIESKRKHSQLLKSSIQGLKGAIEASAKAHGINVDAKISQDNKAIDISITSVSFNAWIEWLDALQSENGIRLLASEILPNPQNSDVKITGQLAAAS